MKRLILLILPLFLVSCAGYQMGGNKPSHLAYVKRIQVPLFVNDTQQIRAEAYATNSAVDALTRDGTYKIGSADTADAILEGTVDTIRYSQFRSSSNDTLKSEELSMEITIKWVLKDAKNPTRILDQGDARGTTRFFAGSNIEIAKTNALPDALARASEKIVSRIADGF